MEVEGSAAPLTRHVVILDAGFLDHPPQQHGMRSSAFRPTTQVPPQSFAIPDTPGAASILKALLEAQGWTGACS